MCTANNTNEVPCLKRHALEITLFFVLMIVISYLYTIFSGHYNGDFLGGDTSLSPTLLALLFILSLLPYLFLYDVYLVCGKRNNAHNVNYKINGKYLHFISCIILFIHILLAFFNIGVMGQVNNRSLAYVYTLLSLFNPYLFSFASICYSRRLSKFNILLLILLSIMRQALGGFIYIFVFVYLIHGKQIKKTIRRYFLLSLCMLFFVPVLVTFLYSMRDSMRAGETVEFVYESDEDIILGKLCGRLSSYSNLCNIFENIYVWDYYIKNMSDYHYLYTILDRFGFHLNTVESPERFMYYSYINADYSDSSTTFMLGTVGMLVISLLKSIKSFGFTLFMILLLIYFSFILMRRVPIAFNLELCFWVLIFPIMSGVSYELFFAFIQILIFSSVVHMIGVKKNSKYSITSLPLKN